jgi:hypothetical protein
MANALDVFGDEFTRHARHRRARHGARLDVA